MTNINEIANKILTGEITVDEAVNEYTAALTKEVNTEKTKREEEEKKKEEEKARIAEQKAFEDTRRAELSDIIGLVLDFLQHYFPDFIPVSFKLTKEETEEMADDLIAEINAEVARMKPYKHFFDLFGKDTTTSKDKEPKPVRTIFGDIPVAKDKHTAFTSAEDKELFNDLIDKIFNGK